jgi:hypothetical protein
LHGGGETPVFFLTFSLPGSKKGKSLTQKGDHFIWRKKKDVFGKNVYING